MRAGCVQRCPGFSSDRGRRVSEGRPLEEHTAHAVERARRGVRGGDRLRDAGAVGASSLTLRSTRSVLTLPEYLCIICSQNFVR